MTAKRVTIRTPPKPHQRTIGELLYQGRLDKNLTQVEIAEAVGIAQKTYSNVERNRGGGYRAVSPDTLAMIFTVLGLDPDLAYYKLGTLPPDVRDTLADNWTLYQAVIEAARKVQG